MTLYSPGHSTHYPLSAWKLVLHLSPNKNESAPGQSLDLFSFLSLLNTLVVMASVSALNATHTLKLPNLLFQVYSFPYMPNLTLPHECLTNISKLTVPNWVPNLLTAIPPKTCFSFGLLHLSKHVLLSKTKNCHPQLSLFSTFYIWLISKLCIVCCHNQHPTNFNDPYPLSFWAKPPSLPINELFK